MDNLQVLSTTEAILGADCPILTLSSHRRMWSVSSGHECTTQVLLHGSAVACRMTAGPDSDDRKIKGEWIDDCVDDGSEISRFNFPKYSHGYWERIIEELDDSNATPFCIETWYLHLVLMQLISQRWREAACMSFRYNARSSVRCEPLVERAFSSPLCIPMSHS